MLLKDRITGASAAIQQGALSGRLPQSRQLPLAVLWPGDAAGWNLGLRHGLFCLGCCWALMLVMFAVGVGSLAWMAALTGVMTIEKTAAVAVTGLVILMRNRALGASDGGDDRPEG